MTPWDQLPDESPEAFVRFLRYRNLGPGRSHRKAYLKYLQEEDGYQGGLKGLTVPGSWREESIAYEWPKRAAAWDVHNLQVYGSRLAVLHVQTITLMAAKNRRLAKRPDMTPEHDNWPALVESARVVGEFLTPALLANVNRGAELARRTALPAGLAGGSIGQPDDGVR